MSFRLLRLVSRISMPRSRSIWRSSNDHLASAVHTTLERLQGVLADLRSGRSAAGSTLPAPAITSRGWTRTTKGSARTSTLCLRAGIRLHYETEIQIIRMILAGVFDCFPNLTLKGRAFGRWLTQTTVDAAERPNAS